MRKIHHTAWRLVLLSSALQVLIFPLPGLYWLSWIAVAPLLVALRRTQAPQTLQVDASLRLEPATPWQAFILSYLCGILWYLGTCYWIFDTMRHYGGLSTPLALLVLLAACMYMGLYHGMFGLLLALTNLCVGFPNLFHIDVKLFLNFAKAALSVEQRKV